jgi:hypothetical protein
MENLAVHRIVAAIVFAIGLALMAYKIYADSEPGLIPIMLVATSTAWYFITRIVARSH